MSERADILLRAIHPLVRGATTNAGIVLETIATEPTVRLEFRDDAGCRFAVRFCRAGGARFANAGRLDLLLDTSVQPSRAVERFVRALAERVSSTHRR